jgi:predicted RNA binding protein YcfA (HicA-like mRNA interferase family)
MKIPRDTSGAELINVLCRHFGYVQVHQVGSHVILQTEEPVHHRIALYSEQLPGPSESTKKRSFDSCKNRDSGNA